MSRGPEKGPFFQLWTPLEGTMVIVDPKYLTRDFWGQIWSTQSVCHLWVLTFMLKNWWLKLGSGFKISVLDLCFTCFYPRERNMKYFDKIASEYLSISNLFIWTVCLNKKKRRVVLSISMWYQQNTFFVMSLFVSLDMPILNLTIKVLYQSSHDPTTIISVNPLPII